jgi:hypothetical protein
MEEDQHVEAEIHQQPSEAGDAIEEKIPSKGHIPNQTVPRKREEHLSVGRCHASRLVFAVRASATTTTTTTTAAATVATTTAATAVSATTAVAAVSTTTTASIATVAAAAAIPRVGAALILAGARFVARDTTAGNLLLIQAFDSGLRLVLVRHLDKSKASRAARFSIDNDTDTRDLAKLTERLLDFVLCGSKGQITNVNIRH